MKRIHLISYCTLLLSIGCGGQPKAASPAPAAEPLATPATSVPEVPPPVSSAAPPAAAPGPKLVLEIKEGLSTPESVLYDEAQDRYLISNINGAPTDVDNNGFIAEVSPEGKVTNAKFIAAAANKVKLDAPKGLGISKGILYVADIASVRKFDAKTGAPKGEIAVAGASFLNDIAVATDGKIYVSDSGLKAGSKGLDPSGTDAVYVIEGNKARAIAKSKELKGPNGLAFMDNELVVVSFAGDEAYKLSDKGERSAVTKLPAGSLDGIVVVDGELLISSWTSSSIYRGKLGSQFVVAIPEVPAPADVGYDTKRKRVLVPLFKDNAVKVFELP
jgi:sugar lactone lactonase YvrE